MADGDNLRDLLGSPLEPEPTRPWWPWLVAAVAGAIVVLIVLSSDDEPSNGIAAATTTTTTPTVPPPAPQPDGRVFYELAYHPVAAQMVMFGGAEITSQGGAGGLLAGTWLLDPATLTWSEHGSEVEPAGRTGHALAYDGSSQLIVLFGGGSAPRTCGVSGPCAVEPLGDTWVFDIETTTWTQRLPAVSPSARYGAAMAYDAESEVLVLFGGGVRSGSSFVSLPMADTWTYDVGANVWTELSPAQSPPARAWAEMAYDPGTDRILMFGGGAPGMVDDLVWAFDANTNTWQPFEGTGPAARWGAAVAFDEQSRQLVVAGGHGPVVRSLGGGTATDIQFLDDIWVFDPQRDSWEPRQLLDGVAYWISAAWDPGTDRTVTFVFGALGTYDVATSAWEWQDATD